MNQPTLLLVEDDPADALLTQRAFRKAEIEISIQVVKDGDAALAYLLGEGEYADRSRYPLPVITLLDLKLPRRSGHEVLVWLRQQPELKRLPVVVLTSSQESADVNRAYDLGANAYLVKPVGFAPLLDMIKTLNLFWLLMNQKPEIQCE